MKRPFKIITVTFDSSSKKYAYFCDFDVEVDDYVVVFARSELQLVMVAQTSGISKSARDKAHSLVVCKIDMDEYNQRNAIKEKYLEIKESLATLREEYDEFAFYEKIAKDNPDMQKMLDELDQLANEQPALENKTES